MEVAIKSNNLFFLCVILLMVVSCGGSGGESAIPLADVTPPTSEIIYPSTNALILNNQNTVNIRGVARDPSGLSEVSVNGVKVTNIIEPNGATTEWSWEVELDVPETEVLSVIVATRDTLGNVDTQAAQIKISKRQYIPQTFIIDNDNHRIIGNTLWTEQFKTIDLNSGNQETFNIKDRQAGSLYAYIEGQNAFVHAKYINGFLTVYENSLDTNVVTKLASLNIEDASSDWRPWSAIDIEYVSELNSTFCVVQFQSKTSNDTRTVIYSYDHIANAISAAYDSNISFFHPRIKAVKYVNDKLLMLSILTPSDSEFLYWLDLKERTLSRAARFSKLGFNRLNVDADSTFAYVSGAQGVGRINIDSGEYSLISEDEKIKNARSAEIDEENNELLLSVGEVIRSVDLDSGQVTKRYFSEVGQGPEISSPRELIFDDTKNILYAVNDGSESSYVIATDLKSGIRSTVIEKPDNVFTTQIRDLIIDKQNQHLYLLYSQRIFKIDISSGTISEIFNIEETNNEGIGFLGGFDLDIERNRIIIYDITRNIIFGLALNNLEYKVLADLGNIGTKNAIDTSFDLAFDGDANVAYLLSQFTASVTRVDLSNGNTELVFESCKDSVGRERFWADSASIQNVAFDGASNSLLVTGFDILEYNLDNSICRPIENTFSTFDITTMGEKFLLGSYFGLIYQYVRETGEKVIISK